MIPDLWRAYLKKRGTVIGAGRAACLALLRSGVLGGVFRDYKRQPVVDKTVLPQGTGAGLTFWASEPHTPWTIKDDSEIKRRAHDACEPRQELSAADCRSISWLGFLEDEEIGE